MSFTIEPLFAITTYSHFFKITKISNRGRSMLLEFGNNWIHRAYRPQRPNPYQNKAEVADKFFGWATHDGYEIRYHLGQLGPLLDFMRYKGYGSDYIPIDKTPDPRPALMKSGIKIQEHWELRGQQPQVVEFLSASIPEDMNSRLVTLSPGSGKTVVSMWHACQRGFRTAIVIKPGYISKWAHDVKNCTTAQDKDFLIIQGSDYIRGLLSMVKDGTLTQSFIIFSLKTWVMFINAYSESPEKCVEEYGCSPDELIIQLGIGTVVFDEIHQWLHAVFQTMCFLHVGQAVGLSATFLSQDHFLDRIQKTIFPKEIRFEAANMKKYIKAYGINYGISPESMDKIKTTERNSTSYSQNKYEDSILKNPRILKNFLELVKEVVNNGFMDQYKPGYKCVIYVRKVKMCTVIVDYLKKLYEDQGLDIRRYASTMNDPYDNLLSPDIRVTTNGSGGTGHDIPGLMTCITFDNIGEPASNIQTFGRLREPKEGVARYYTVFSDRIQRQYQYYVKRRGLLEDRSAVFREFRSEITL